VELASEFEVREALPNTWHPFLAKFGRLTGIQRRAMIPIAGGCSALVCAPTASGKTEAVVVPLIERLWGEGVGKGEERKALVVMVSPTRALANDLFRRLQGLIGRRGDLTLSIRTGDQRVSDRGTREGEELGGAQGPTIMLVTPESLDSYLTRKPAELRRVLAVVLDELHLLQASGRGDQLSGLLSRLEKVSPGFQRCALSATVADPEGLARRFLGQGARVLRVGEGVGQGEEGSGDGQRALSLSLLPIYTEEDAPKAVIGTLSQPQTRKVLVFVNRRQDAERLTAQLRARKPSVEAVLIHHGSLERAHRRQTEAQLLSLRSWICVATMTLELGVDIGDIDQIVLLNPAPDTSSFMQRVGRAKRRGGVIQALGLYESEFERQRLLFQESNGRAGRNFSEMFPFRPWVVVQQALSMMYQFRGKRAISAQALWNRLPP
jgi:ATP-dependent Lhr-like helicase